MSTRAKVITAVMLAILTICVIFLSLLSRQNQLYLQEIISTKSESAQTVTAAILNQIGNKYRLRIKAFINYKISDSKTALVAAFAGRDRQKLQELSKPFFTFLQKENPYFSTLGWILPDNTAFLRVHNSTNYGQDVTRMRPDVAAVNQDRRQRAGFTTGYVGLQYRVVQPVFFHDEYIGATQFGIEGLVLLDALSRQLKAPVGLAIPNEEYATIRPEHRKGLAGPTHTIEFTDSKLFNDQHAAIDWQQKQQILRRGEKTYALCRVSTLTNFQGKELALLFVALDISSEIGQGRSQLVTALASGTLLMALSFVILYFSYGALVQKIVDLNRSLARTNRDLEARAKERTRKLLTEIEERKQTEARLQKAEKMEAIGLMAGGVAHDLNNILSGVVSYPELLLMKLPEDSELRGPIHSIHESGLRAAAVVADLLTVARSAAKVREIADLNALIHDYLASLEGQKLLDLYPQITIKTRLAPDLLGIFCSPVHVRKCLMNLVINAAEALKNSGTITISTANRELSGTADDTTLRPGRYVALMITDNGPGIAAEDREHIFEPFYTKKKMGRSGTGIGLAVVWNAMQDHKGSVQVQSSAQQGTTFTLLFPATTARQDRVSQETSPDILHGNGERILVVDDEPHQRDIASQILEVLGYEVATASSGEEAVAYLARHEVELVLLDMLMEPGMNGRQTYAEILNENPGQKAVIASGFSESDEVKKTEELGAGGFIKKPYTLEELAVAVRGELDRRP